MICVVLIVRVSFMRRYVRNKRGIRHFLMCISTKKEGKSNVQLDVEQAHENS